MATPYQTRVMSTPSVLIDGVVIPIVPNSGKIGIVGSAKVRVMSFGGGAVQVAAGDQAETDVGYACFDIAATNENMDRVRAWKAKALVGVGTTLNFITPDGQYPHQMMFLSKDTEAHMAQAGNIHCEWQGQAVF